MNMPAMNTVQQTEPATCCIVGAGPGGAVLALLLARQGVSVALLEEHQDFEREFRGDTLHPATMEIMDEIDLADRLLELRHTKVRSVGLPLPAGVLRLDLGSGFARWKTKFPYVTVMAQSRFLQFITDEARRYANFRLILGAPAEGLIEEGGVVRGVRYRAHDGEYELRADLTVAADGRFSRVRKLAALHPVKTSPPMDVLWFRLSRHENDRMEGLEAHVGYGVFVVLIDRFDYWQVGCIIPKGGYQQVRAAGIPRLRQALAQAVPQLADRVEELEAWKQISVLSVESSRLRRWYRPGLLLIGDAAHVMSPVGGVGINYAIADAVVASNVLGPKLKAGVPIRGRDLAAVQRQRSLPTRVIQIFQSLAQRVVMTRVRKAAGGDVFTPPRFVRLLLRTPGLLVLPARLIGFGLWPPHVRMAE